VIYILVCATSFQVKQLRTFDSLFFFTISSGVLSFSPSINGKMSARLENERKFDAKEVHKCGEKEKIFDAGLIFEPRDIIIIKKKL
jgi:hypothetical protein